MLESKDHQQVIIASGALDLTFAQDIRGWRVAKVKSAPLVHRPQECALQLLDRPLQAADAVE